MFNKLILVGNLTRDIELRYAQSGTAIAKTAIATSRKFTSNGEKKEEVCFVDVTFFGRSGEIANQYLRKGSKILVEGRLNFEQWVDQNGQKRSKHSVIAETMQMLDSKGDNQGSGGFNAPSNAPMDDANQGGGYNAPTQGQGQNYQQPKQQQQSYQKPAQQQSYNNNNQAAQQQSRQMPSPDTVPSYDINEDEIPF
ncbi:single-stranded DNA-binding protein [Sulfurimonas sp. SAG-AH-194-C21]|nr:single-stranded DNA-binding protein [Sulfurimonas sp. SAG-AH-194-C21]MDF1883565.1 single-stranded DNA-binding protein [Sulfurimonas sp. SAG-AH-194-C21]